MNPNKYETLSKWVWDAGMPTLLIIMICSHTRLTDCLSDLFAMLADACNKRFHADERIFPQDYYDKLFKEILFEGQSNTHTIIERAKHVGIAINDNYEVFVIMLKQNDSYPAIRLARECAGILPKSRIIMRAYQTIILNAYSNVMPNLIGQKRADNREKMRALLEKRNAVCGVSEIFTNFIDLRIAYTQAVRAISYGSAITAFQDKWDAVVGGGIASSLRDSLFFHYDDYYIYYVHNRAREKPFDIFQNVPLASKVYNLVKEGKELSTKRALILYTYLACERNASKAGGLLHMHRNNVLYHIPQIEKELDVNLESFQDRMKLIHIFEMIEIEQAFAFESDTDNLISISDALPE